MRRSTHAICVGSAAGDARISRWQRAEPSRALVPAGMVHSVIAGKRSARRGGQNGIREWRSKLYQNGKKRFLSNSSKFSSLLDGRTGENGRRD